MDSQSHEDQTTPDPGVRRTSRTRRARRDWVVVTRGACHEPEPLDLASTVLRAWQSVLPARARFTHLTGAEIRGWWCPPTCERMPVLVAVPESSARPARPGLRVTRVRSLGPADRVDGLRVASPAEILLACARDLGDLDLAVLLTSALRSGDVDRDSLSETCAGGRPGSRRLRRVLAYADPRMESPWEVLLSRFHAACEVEVHPQHDVHDVDGAFLARGDLWLVGTRRLHEYDGADHLSRSRQRADLKRDARLARAGWERRGYTREDVLHQAVRILRDCDEAIGRDHDPARARAWHRALLESLFTPAGSAALMTRWGIPTTGGAGAS